MTIDPIQIRTRKPLLNVNPMRYPNPLAFAGKLNIGLNAIKRPSTFVTHAGDTVVSKIKPLRADVFENSKFMTR